MRTTFEFVMYVCNQTAKTSDISKTIEKFLEEENYRAQKIIERWCSKVSSQAALLL